MTRSRWILALACLAVPAVLGVARTQAPQQQPATAAPVAAAPVAVASTEVAPAADPVAATTTRPAVTAPATAPSTSSDSDGAPPAVRGAAGLVMAIDPDSGEPGLPSAEQLSQLAVPGAEDLNYSAEGLRTFNLPQGGKGVDLEGRFQDYAVVRIAPDGSKVFGCVGHPADASHVHPAPAAQAEVE